jgi:hypothetical protein
VKSHLGGRLDRLAALARCAHEGAAGVDQERDHDEAPADQLAAPEEDRGERQLG